MVNYRTEEELERTNCLKEPMGSEACKGGRFHDASDDGPSGRDRHIRKITGKDEVRQHLAELGFVVDSDVTVVSEIGGNLICR